MSSWGKMASIKNWLLKNIFAEPQKNLFKTLIFLLFSISLVNTIRGAIPFWFDPARDLLLAVENIQKPTLIGQPTGIPGIFYGPYWIWALSTTLVVTKDPRFVTITVILVPYFILFPYIMSKFSKVFGSTIPLILTAVFFASFPGYVTLWNPNFAPMLILLLIYLIVLGFSEKKSSFGSIRLLAAGVCVGLLFSISISLGLGIFFSTLLFIFYIHYHFNKKIISRLFFKSVYSILLYIIGFLLTLVPYFIFELRHNFLQTESLITTLSQSIIHNSAIVGQVGFGKLQVMSQLFLVTPAKLLSIESRLVLPIYLIAGFIIYKTYKFKFLRQFNVSEKILLTYSCLCLFVLLILYVTSKNPVWEYHFIGVEVIFILLLGIFLKKLTLLNKVFLFWAGVLVIASFLSFATSFWAKPYLSPTLKTKEYIVNRVYQHAKGKPFTLFTYSPSIYTYDFDYLVSWIGQEKYGYLPNKIINADVDIFLIIPETSEASRLDFINYKTPNSQFATVDEWKIPDGTVIVKRAPIINSELEI